MADEHTILIENGTVSFIYSDDLAPLVQALGATVTRASHVEPHPSGGWIADMRPSGGPILGAQGSWANDDLAIDMVKGFALREEALAAERVWLAKEKGL
jgi:hypothetical protein